MRTSHLIDRGDPRSAKYSARVWADRSASEAAHHDQLKCEVRMGRDGQFFIGPTEAPGCKAG